MIKVIYPYYRHFRCIADKCPESCCRFRIDFFKWEEQQFRTRQEWCDIDGRGNSLTEYLEHDSNGWHCKSGKDGACIFWGNDRLCQIQKHFDINALPAVCRTFPRVVSRYPDRMEYALDSCCPVVAASFWNWETGNFIIEGTPEAGICAPADSLTEKRNAAMRILADETVRFSDCLRRIADMFGCNVSIPDIELPADRLGFIRKASLLLVWENVLFHEKSAQGNVIMTLLLQFISEFSGHLAETACASRWEISVDYSRKYIQFVTGTPIEPNDEERFTDIIPE